MIGLAVATGASVATGVSLSPTAQAAGSVWDRVAACESSGNWATNTGNGYTGGLQFSASTWRAYGGSNYASSANLASKSAQIAVAQRVLASQGPGAWPSCGVRAGLTRASAGGYSVSTVSRSRARVAIAPLTSHHARHRASHSVNSTSNARLWVDGQLGPRTIGAIQRWVGVSRTGALTPGTVSGLQRAVGAYPDGVIGRRTIYSLQTRLGIRHDGSRHLNAATVAALQRYLNQH